MNIHLRKFKNFIFKFNIYEDLAGDCYAAIP